jgi:hypothetical protein
MDLTVAIPTYNRGTELRVLLERLLPMVERRCKLLIVDNCSDVPVAEMQRTVFDAWPQVDLTIVRNRANVGGAANILRCFELCGTEWMWLLGDDDVVDANALETIEKYIAEYPTCTFFNFSSPRFRRQEFFSTRGRRGFVEGLDSFPNALFMSVGVYKTQAIVKHLRYGYHHSYSLAPQLACLISSLGTDGQCAFCPDQILSEMVTATDTWSPISWLLGRMTILDLPFDTAERRTLAGKLAATPSVEFIATHLVMQGCADGNSKETTYLYDQICSRSFYFRNSPLHRLRLGLYRLLVRFPFVGRRVIEVAFKLLKDLEIVKRNPLQKLASSDRFTRM